MTAGTRWLVGMLGIALLVLAGCQPGGFGPAGSGTGSIVAHAVWPGQPGYSVASIGPQTAQYSPAAVPGTVSSLTATVNSVPPVSGGPWLTGAGTGTIDNVPAGGPYTVTLMGYPNALGSGSPSFQGAKTGVMVTAGATPTNTGSISMTATTTNYGTRLGSATGVDTVVGDFFAGTVAISGNYYAVGAPNNGSGTGKAYVFNRTSTDTLDAGIGLPFPGAGFPVYFGTSVGLTTGQAGGDFLIAGAMNATGGVSGTTSTAGAAWIYQRDTSNSAILNAWPLTPTQLLDPNGVANDSFGFSVAISGDYAVVGAPFKKLPLGCTLTPPCTWQGAAFVFHRTSGNSWSAPIQLIIPANATTTDQFGASVAITTGGAGGDYLIVGASGAKGFNVNTPITGAGNAFIFMRTGTNTWDSGTQVPSGDAVSNDQFGHAVAISGDYAIVGAYQHPYDNVNFKSGPGKAYVYQRTGTVNVNTWSAAFAMSASDEVGPTTPAGLNAFGDQYGSSVAISTGSTAGDFAIVGANERSSDRTEATPAHLKNGGAYIWQRTGTGGTPNVWTQLSTIPIGDAQQDYFGSAVGINGLNTVIGSAETSNGGTIYLY